MTGWSVHHGNTFDVLPFLGDRSVDHIITDPPYSEHVHGKSRRGASLPSNERNPCGYSRAHELGFDAITDEDVARAADHFARIVRRWVLVFCDVESVHRWMVALQNAGLDYVRTGAWVKLRATPQFTGDRPASGFEAIVIAHRKGRKRWNGGGSHAVWTYPVVQNCSGHRQDRIHTAQKPVELMLELVALFTDPGDLVLDPFAGSGTTGVACIRTGRAFIGYELKEEYVLTARERLEAEQNESTLQAQRMGQVPLWGGAGGR